MLGLSSFNVLVHLSPLGNERRIIFQPFAKMAFILIGNKKVRPPKGETDVEGFTKVVDSFYRICTQKNLNCCYPYWAMTIKYKLWDL